MRHLTGQECAVSGTASGFQHHFLNAHPRGGISSRPIRFCDVLKLLSDTGAPVAFVQRAIHWSRLAAVLVIAGVFHVPASGFGFGRVLPDM
jgi:hypothetical protein